MAPLAGEVCTQAPIRHFRGLHTSSANFYSKCGGGNPPCLNCSPDFGPKCSLLYFNIINVMWFLVVE